MLIPFLPFHHTKAKLNTIPIPNPAFKPATKLNASATYVVFASF